MMASRMIKLRHLFVWASFGWWFVDAATESKMYMGSEVAGIRSYDDSRAFCEAREGLVLGAVADYCNQDIGVPRQTGVLPTSQWAPVADRTNDWVQLGTYYKSTTYTVSNYATRTSDITQWDATWNRRGDGAVLCGVYSRHDNGL